MRDLAIDPVTHDYYEDADHPGDLATTDTCATMAYLQLVSELDSWVGDPDAGTKLAALRRRGSSEAAAHEAADTVLAALQALVDEGVAYDPEAVAERDGTSRVLIRSTIHDAAHGEIDLAPFIPYEV